MKPRWMKKYFEN